MIAQEQKVEALVFWWDFFNALLKEVILKIPLARLQFCWMLAEAGKLYSINQRGKSW